MPSKVAPAWAPSLPVIVIRLGLVLASIVNVPSVLRPVLPWDCVRALPAKVRVTGCSFTSSASPFFTRLTTRQVPWIRAWSVESTLESFFSLPSSAASAGAVTANRHSINVATRFRLGIRPPGERTGHSNPRRPRLATRRIDTRRPSRSNPARARPDPHHVRLVRGQPGPADGPRAGVLHGGRDAGGPGRRQPGVRR